ncbi:UNVERIFIED_ORG: hypothetical protein B2H93_18200 [Clostridium botulinum]
MNTSEIGNRIKKRRQELNLTLQQVADRVKVNKSTIQRYETGNIKDVKLPVIESIANVLNVDPLWLIGKIEETKKHSEEYEHITYLVNTYFNSVLNWSEDKLLSEEETVIIREHFSDLLSRYKKMIENLVSTKLYWNNCKDSYSNLYKNKKTPLSNKEIKELFLKQELETNIEDITNLVRAFPNWVARNEYDTKDNITELKVTEEKSEYIPETLAAHAKENQDPEANKRDIDKIKSIMAKKKKL